MNAYFLYKIIIDVQLLAFPNSLHELSRTLFLIGFQIAWGIGIYLLARAAGCLLRLRGESLVLARETLRSDLGWYQYFYDVRCDWGRPEPRARIELIAKDEVDAVRLERIGGNQRLSVDRGANRIEIGRFLPEAEREWLASVLAGWVDGTIPTDLVLAPSISLKSDAVPH